MKLALQILKDTISTGEKAADESWAATLAEYLPYCVIRSRSISVLRNALQCIHLKYIQLKQHKYQRKEEEEEEGKKEKEEKKEERKNKKERQLRLELMQSCRPMLPDLLPTESTSDFVTEYELF